MAESDVLAGFDYGKIRGLSGDPSEREVCRLFWRDDMEDYSVVKWLPQWPIDSITRYTNNDIPAYEGGSVLCVYHPTRVTSEAYVKFGCFAEQKIAFQMMWYKREYTRYGGFVGQVRNEASLAEGRKGMLRWNSGIPGWEYRDANDVINAIPSAGEVIVDDSWNFLRIVIDWENDTFHRLTTNLLDLDISDLALQPSTDIPSNQQELGQFRVMLGFYGDASPPYNHYVDDTRLYLNWIE